MLRMCWPGSRLFPPTLRPLVPVGAGWKSGQRLQDALPGNALHGKAGSVFDFLFRVLGEDLNKGFQVGSGGPSVGFLHERISYLAEDSS